MMEIVSDSINCISKELSKGQLFDLVRGLVSIIKRCDTKVEKPYSLLISALVERYKKEKNVHYITAIAILLEQFPASLSESLLTSILEEISSIDDNVFYRNETWLDDQWFMAFSVVNSPMFEIRSGSSITERIFSSVCLLLAYRQRESLEKVICEYGWKRIGLVFQTLNSHECQKNNIPTPDYDENMPVMFPEYIKDEYRDEARYLPIVVNGDYLNYADYITHPENRNMLSLHLQLFSEIVNHYTKQHCPEKALRRCRRNSVLETFDVEYQPTVTSEKDSK